MLESISHDDDATGGTLAGRRQPLKQPPLLAHAESPTHRQRSVDRGVTRSGRLRVVNKTRLSSGSEGSVLADFQSSSTIPQDWDAAEFAADQQEKARWRDSVDSGHTRNSTAPLSFHDRTVDILIKIRLLPVMKALHEPENKGALVEASKRAQDVLEFAVLENASIALQGRCCYYIGVAKHLLNDTEASKYFLSALDAKGVYGEGRWAQQWTNHYENLSELSPNRIAHSDRPISWASNIGYWRDVGNKTSPESGISSRYKMGSPRQGMQQIRNDISRQSPGGGIQATTPVSKRFSLDIRDEPLDSGTFGSRTAGSREGRSSVGGGGSVPSFSSWGSESPSGTAVPSHQGRDEIVLDTDGLHSPRCTHVSPIQETVKGFNSTPDANLGSPQSPRHHMRSKSTTFSIPAPALDVGEQETSRSRRRQSSRFHVDPPSVLKEIQELSIDSVNSSEDPVKTGPSAPYAESASDHDS